MSSLLLQAIRRQAQVSLPQILQPVPLVRQLGGVVANPSWQSPIPSTPPSTCTCSGSRTYASLSIQQVEQLRRELSRPAKSLQYDQRPPPIPSEVSQSMLGKLLLNVLMYNDTRNQQIVGGQVLYDAIREQVDDGALCTAFGMDPKIFYSTYTLLAIHVWMVIHKLAHRNDRDSRFFKQRFYNHFQADVERRIYEAGVQIGVTKWLKKLEQVFYSSGLSFDRVLRGEDLTENGQSISSTSGSSATPSSGVSNPVIGVKSPQETLKRMELVVLREFFGGDASKTLQAELITRYLLRELKGLEETDDQAIMQGRVQFSREPFEATRLQLERNAAAPPVSSRRS